MNQGRHSPDPRELEQLLTELKQVELPSSFRNRLFARLLRESERGIWWDRLMSPRFAWGVAAACVVALVAMLTYVGTRGPTPEIVPGLGQPRGGQEFAEASRSTVEPVVPAENSVVGAGDVEIVAAIYPPLERGLVRLYVDDTDVTGVSEVTDSYVIYSPAERLAEGEHIVTIEISDTSGRTLRDFSWLFYAVNGEARAQERI